MSSDLHDAGAPTPEHLDALRGRLSVVRRRIAAAGADPGSVEILAVTKTRGPEFVRAALAVGLVDVGENYAQELEAKAAVVDGARWHFIGGIQRNKVRRLADVVWLWQSVDRPSVVAELAKRAPGARILVQVRPEGEAEAKSGCPLAEAPALIERAGALGLRVEGAMTVGPTDAATDPRPTFAAVRALVDRFGLTTCSMGMSRDLEVAIQEGATMIRIGTDLFGPRS